MFCCLPDPCLANLLAGETLDIPNDREALWVIGALIVQLLALLAAGALPW